jgi:hypothetical protein
MFNLLSTAVSSGQKACALRLAPLPPHYTTLTREKGDW